MKELTHAEKVLIAVALKTLDDRVQIANLPHTLKLVKRVAAKLEIEPMLDKAQMSWGKRRDERSHS